MYECMYGMTNPREGMMVLWNGREIHRSYYGGCVHFSVNFRSLDRHQGRKNEVLGGEDTAMQYAAAWISPQTLL